MHGVQNFPTKIENERVNKVSILKKNFNCIVGYANHTSGDLEEANLLIYWQLVLVKVLEKHIIINRKDKHFDYFSSLEPQEFKKYVQIIKKGQSAFDTYKGFEITNSDIKYRIFQKKKYCIIKKR